MTAKTHRNIAIVTVVIIMVLPELSGGFSLAQMQFGRDFASPRMFKRSSRTLGAPILVGLVSSLRVSTGDNASLSLEDRCRRSAAHKNGRRDNGFGLEGH